MAANMFRHNIGPNGEVLEMRDLLGREVRGDPIVVNDTPLPISLSGEFLLFLNDNKLPNGRVNPLQNLRPEEVAMFGKPYREWAPAPFNNTRNPAESAANLFMFAFSGMEDLFDFSAILGGRFEGLSMVDYELGFNKQRAWGGLVPLSDRRLREKGLHQLDDSLPPKRFVYAIDHLEKTDVFLYFNIPERLGKMRKAYNRVYEHLAHFDQALASYYARRQEPRDPNSPGKAAELWAEFFFSRVEFMTTRAHQWYMSHANALHAQLVEMLRTQPPQAGDPRGGTRNQLEVLVQRRTKAELSLLIPLTGFKNPLAHWKRLSSPPIVNWTYHLNARGAFPIPAGTYPQDVGQRETVFTTRLQHLLQAQGNGSDDAIRRQTQAWAALDQVSSEMRGNMSVIPTPITEELWVTCLKARMTRSSDQQLVTYTHWGFVAYRLDYSHSHEEWSSFLAKFNSDVSAWAEAGNEEHVLGASSIKQSCKITWLDGRDHGIPENDIPAARRHFASLCETKSPLINSLLLAGDVFLVADRGAISSYLNPPSLPGQESIDTSDLKSHIVLVQGSNFNAEQAARDKEAPGYSGLVWVAGCALFEDVFPGLFMTLYEPKQLWNISACHPGGVYLGAPLAKYQWQLWKGFNELQFELIRVAMVELLDGSSLIGRQLRDARNGR
ncbi:hypothetical protein QBC37DRAFT_60435 [Rhypophila decipiens]|uniref:Uncharacterized protein n=1 Tax=Rhypophila decipiens TaxID=261697 RepID=A0AAN7B3U9_9PEZI|nr:hypothetical protein QBC37DRAFT_60435 [Rhypophila decipiens]